MNLHSPRKIGRIATSRYNAYAFRQEKRCLNAYGKSYDAMSIMRHVPNEFIFEVRKDVILCDWIECKRAMREYADSIQDYTPERDTLVACAEVLESAIRGNPLEKKFSTK